MENEDIDDITARHDSLGERMKKYEESTEQTISRESPFIIRLDGHSFHTFTRGFIKPFDEFLSQAMINTASDLLEYFNDCRTAYTQSDEITLIFPKPASENQMLLFSGRVGKIATLAAGYCSARFNWHLAHLVPADHPQYARAQKGIAHFDARIFNVPTDVEVFNNVYWRSTYDCARNSRFAYGLFHLGQKRVHGLTSRKIIEVLKEEKQLDWNDLSGHVKWGSIIKKERYTIEAVNQKSNETTEAVRARIVAKAIHLDTFRPEFVDMLLRKYWNETTE